MPHKSSASNNVGHFENAMPIMTSAKGIDPQHGLEQKRNNMVPFLMLEEIPHFRMLSGVVPLAFATLKYKGPAISEGALVGGIVGWSGGGHRFQEPTCCTEMEILIKPSKVMRMIQLALFIYSERIVNEGFALGGSSEQNQQFCIPLSSKKRALIYGSRHIDYWFGAWLAEVSSNKRNRSETTKPFNAY
eukprot:scaffold22596_cov131-Cylindrotheca_fusiformis.AAC.7